MHISRSKFLDVRRIERKEFEALFPCGDTERVHGYISPCGRRLTNRPHSLKRNRLAERARSPIMRPLPPNRADGWRTKPGWVAIVPVLSILLHPCQGGLPRSTLSSRLP